MTPSTVELLSRSLAPAEVLALGDRQLEIRRAGPRSCRTSILLHGLGSSSAGYRAQLSELSEQRHVVAWNAPGFGRSTALTRPSPSLREYSDAVMELVDALGQEGVDLVGSSWGSLIAADVAATYPERVNSLVLISPTMGYTHLSLSEREAQIQARIDGFNSDDPALRASRFLAPGAEPIVVQRFLELRRDTNTSGYAAATAMLYSSRPLDVYQRVKVPVLIIAGAQDKVCPAKAIDQVRATLPDAALIMLAGCGHIPKLEKPDEVNKALAEFWEKRARI